MDKVQLRSCGKNQLATSLSQKDVNSALGWLSSDLGKRLTSLEEKSGEASEYLQRQKESSNYLKALSPERIEIIRRFVKAIRIGDASASIVINTAVGMTYGMSVVSSHGTAYDVSEIKRSLESQRVQIVGMLERQSIAEFASIYKSVSDRDLNRYIAFATSPPGTRYHEVTIQALDIALTKAATEMGRELGMPMKSASNSASFRFVACQGGCRLSHADKG